MLIDKYSLQNFKKPNHDSLKSLEETSLTFEYKRLVLPTTNPDIFDQYTPGELRNLFETQLSQMEKELAMLQKYNLISNLEAARTRNQYRDLYFDQGFAFLKESLMQQSTSQRNANVTIKSPEKKIAEELDSISPLSSLSRANPTKRFELPSEEGITEDDDSYREEVIREVRPGTIYVSRTAIRNITGYSYNVMMPWHTKPVTITWQARLIDSDKGMIVVDGSRQGGKSMTIAEKLIEESFIPGKDLMVCAFLQETTESIGEYIVTFIENFSADAFTVKERKRYIQNNETGVRIHFRTLKDGAKGIRGKTLRVIVVDEAMLISTEIFESVLLPTQSTIPDAKMIMLGTADENTSCFMYRTIQDIKEQKIYNNEGQRTAEHIIFSVLDNPLMAPMELRRVMDTKDRPTVKREYFNVWGKLEDALFQIEDISYIDVVSQIHEQAHILIAIDPARKQDRSGFAVLHCLNNKIISMQSGEVPPAYKDDWSLQGLFFQNLQKKYLHHKSVSMCIDGTGVGDGVYHIFRNMGLPVYDIVRYTAGDTESQMGDGQYNVGKSLLINNAIDMITEKQIICPRETNELLIEEVKYIQLTKTLNNKIAFRTEKTDDVTNALLIGLYVAKKKRYINRALIDIQPNHSFDEEIKTYQSKQPRFIRQQGQDGW